MKLKRWALLFTLITGLVWALSACGVTDQFSAQNVPTPTNTRRPRPTFTPRPDNTEPPAATNTPEATAVPPTNTPVPPTAKPVVKATAKPVVKPPTAAPQPTAIPPTAAPTANPYPYRWVAYPNCPINSESDTCNIQQGVKCENSGWTGLRAAVLTTLNVNAGISGIKVRFAYSPDDAGKVEPDELTQDDGIAQKVLSSQRGANAGTYYAWVINSSGQRISPISAPMTITTKPAGDPKVCIVATVVFVRN